jgi:hypothetical protein
MIGIGLNESTSDLSSRAMQSFGSLSDLEKFRFNILMGSYVIQLENAYYQHLDGMLSEARWEVLLRQVGATFVAPGHREWWNTYYPKELLHKDFAAILNGIASTAEASIPQS